MYLKKDAPVPARQNRPKHIKFSFSIGQNDVTAQQILCHVDLTTGKIRSISITRYPLRLLYLTFYRLPPQEKVLEDINNSARTMRPQIVN